MPGFYSVDRSRSWDYGGAFALIVVGMALSFSAAVPVIGDIVSTMDFYEESNVLTTYAITHPIAFVAVLVIFFNYVNKLNWLRKYTFVIMKKFKIVDNSRLKELSHSEDGSVPSNVSETAESVEEDLRDAKSLSYDRWSAIAGAVAAVIGAMAIISVYIVMIVYFAACKSDGLCGHGSDNRNLFLYSFWTLGVATICFLYFCAWTIFYLWRMERQVSGSDMNGSSSSDVDSEEDDLSLGLAKRTQYASRGYRKRRSKKSHHHHHRPSSTRPAKTVYSSVVVPSSRAVRLYPNSDYSTSYGLVQQPVGYGHMARRHERSRRAFGE